MPETLTTQPLDLLEPDTEGGLETAKTVRLMDRLHAEEVFSTPEQSKAFLDSLDYDGFKKWISLVNGIERSIPMTQRGEVSGSVVQSEGALTGTDVEYRPPRMGYRDELLKLAFNKSQSIEDPLLAGLTLGLSINAIHYFEDGNGRTARMAFSLLSKGYDGSENDKQYYSSLLENMKGREVINPNPALSGIDKRIRSEMFSRTEENCGYTELYGEDAPSYVFDAFPDAYAGEFSPDKLAVSEDIDAKGREMLFRTIESGGMTMISLMASFPPERVKDYIKVAHDGFHTFVSGVEFLPTLTKEEISNWWNMSERAIVDYVKKLIDVADREDIDEIVADYSVSQTADN